MKPEPLNPWEEAYWLLADALTEKEAPVEDWTEANAVSPPVEDPGGDISPPPLRWSWPDLFWWLR